MKHHQAFGDLRLALKNYMKTGVGNRNLGWSFTLYNKWQLELGKNKLQTSGRELHSTHCLTNSHPYVLENKVSLRLQCTYYVYIIDR